MAKLPLITQKSQVPPEGHRAFDSIAASRGSVHGPFTMFMHYPAGAERVAHLGALVRFEGPLDMRVRAICGMVVAREFEAMYIWGAQTGGGRKLGVPEATIDAIRANHSRGASPEDAQIIDATRMLLRKHRLDDTTRQGLLDRFGGPSGLVELTTVIGYYTMLAQTVNACELEAADGAEVLKV